MIITQQNIIRARWNTFNLCIYLCMPKTKVNCWPASFEVITPPPPSWLFRGQDVQTSGRNRLKIGAEIRPNLRYLGGGVFEHNWGLSRTPMSDLDSRERQATLPDSFDHTQSMVTGYPNSRSIRFSWFFRGGFGKAPFCLYWIPYLYLGTIYSKRSP